MPLYLNQEVSVSFSEDLDPRSVTPDTVYLVKVTDEGDQRVKMRRMEARSRSVALVPEWPLSPELDDGSLQPEQVYKLEVAGFPRGNTVQSRTGHGVGERFVRYYRTVSLDDEQSALLPPGLPSDPFLLTSPELRMAADARTVRMHFTLPLDPTTVSRDGIEFYVAGGNTVIPIESIRILSLSRPSFPWGTRMAYQGTTLELRLGADHELEPGMFWVNFKPDSVDPSKWLADYRGRHLLQPVVPGWISPGERVVLARFAGSDLELYPYSSDGLEFEVIDGLIQVLARENAGTGQLGAFAPEESVVLEPGVAFDLGDGPVRSVGGQFEFSSFWIPAGVSVTLRSTDPVEILSRGRIQIDGVLILDTPSATIPVAFERALVEEGFGCRLVAAGDIVVSGEIRHRRGDAPGSSFVSLVSRAVTLSGPVPRRTVFATELRHDVHGFSQNPMIFRHVRKPGYASGEESSAAAWTEWRQLPADFNGSIDAEALDVADVEVFLQVALPDPLNPTVPYSDPSGLLEPVRLPLREPIPVEPSSFVRFLLRAKVMGGRALPSLRALEIVAG